MAVSFCPKLGSQYGDRLSNFFVKGVISFIIIGSKLQFVLNPFKSKFFELIGQLGNLAHVLLLAFYDTAKTGQTITSKATRGA